MSTPAMTKSEREDLQRLVRQREKVLKSAAHQRSADLLADFENQMGQEFSFDQDEVWEQAKRAADREIDKAKKQIAVRCRELGIPDRFAPTLHLSWFTRGYGNAVAERRGELRRMAKTRIEAIEAKARTEIEMSCLQAQEKIALAGLTSDVTPASSGSGAGEARSSLRAARRPADQPHPRSRRRTAQASASRYRAASR